MYRKDGDKVFIIHVSEMAPQGKLGKLVLLTLADCFYYM